MKYLRKLWREIFPPCLHAECHQCDKVCLKKDMIHPVWGVWLCSQDCAALLQEEEVW